jgi:hypothetical protein
MRCPVRSVRQVGSVVALIVVGSLVWSAGCASNNTGGQGGGDGGSSGGSGSGGSGNGAGSGFVSFDVNRCTVGGACVTQCPDATKTTTISGVVYDPAGKNPLPGIAVYVPATLPLATLPKGASCGDCNSLYKGTVLASDITGPDGSFHIHDAPDGQSIPIVVQAGKWRAQYTTSATRCQDTMIQQKLMLPKSVSSPPNSALPDIAISTGGLDSLECLLTRIGVDSSEYTSGGNSNGHIHIFQGGVGGTGVAGPTSPGGSPQSSTQLWNSTASLNNYDVVLLSCEGGETQAPNPSALEGYVKNGGRVFASHFHYAWFTVNGSPFRGYNLGQFQAGSFDTGDINAVIDTSFAQGQALHDWLALPQVAALTSDQLPIKQSRQNVLQVNNPPVTSWIKAASNVSMPAMPGLTQYFSFDVRVGELTCGRVVYSDLHVGAASSDYGNALNTAGNTSSGIVPDKCNTSAPLSPQEVVLEYMLFNLSSCLAPPNMKPPPPMIAR